MNPRPILTLAAVAIALFAAACSHTPSRPPPTPLESADASVGRAEEARAGDYAAPEMRDAHDKLNASREAARQAQASKDSEAARRSKWLAEESRLDSELAVVKAQNARAQAVNLDLQHEIEKLRPGLPPPTLAPIPAPTEPPAGPAHDAAPPPSETAPPPPAGAAT